jgi:hypothetical protein
MRRNEPRESQFELVRRLIELPASVRKGWRHFVIQRLAMIDQSHNSLSSAPVQNAAHRASCGLGLEDA